MSTGKLVSVFIFFVALLAVFSFVVSSFVDQSSAPVACTLEAKICPDGSAVGRTGPHCEFAPCPIPAPADDGSGSGGEGIAPYHSGVRGTVMLGPTCPVMRDPPDPGCADKPYQTLVTIFRASDTTHALVITQSDAKGNFEASLPPGEYLIGAGESMLPRCAQESASVGPDSYTQVTILCDSGIR